MKARLSRPFWAMSLCTGMLSTSSPAFGGSLDQAARIHNRLAGVPATAQALQQMQQLIDAGKAEEAAMLAVENPYFYNLALKNWVASWTNKDQTNRVPLNDYTATVIGMIRDEVPFNQVLSVDLVYTGKDGLANVPAYSVENNDHYVALETQRLDLKENLVQKQQSTITGIADTAGVMTTRGFGEAFYTAGTNRAALRATFMTYLCRDLEQVSDTSIADYRVRRDVDRRPGGDSAVYRTKCAGCHAGMDGLSGAFAYFDFAENKVTYTPNTVAAKYSVNAQTFPEGAITTDDGWINLWTEGQNAALGWQGSAEGKGAKEYGVMLTQTEAFSQCMSEKVFERVCLHKPTTPEEITAAKEHAADFKSNDFNMKRLFAKTAVSCMGE